jgi:hypothetical protein
VGVVLYKVFENSSLIFTPYWVSAKMFVTYVPNVTRLHYYVCDCSTDISPKYEHDNAVRYYGWCNVGLKCCAEKEHSVM